MASKAKSVPKAKKMSTSAKKKQAKKDAKQALAKKAKLVNCMLKCIK